MTSSLMSLSIYIKDETEAGFVSFDSDDGLYWFLYPYFESVYEETGQMVDLYGYAIFEHELLLELFLRLEEGLTKVNEQPDQWHQSIGRNAKTGEELYVDVDRNESIKRIELMMSLTNKAYNDGKSLECLGD